MAEIQDWLKTTHRPGDPARTVPSAEDANRIANVLQGISGIGCRIVKPIEFGGLGWKVIVDGSSDEPYPDETGYKIFRFGDDSWEFYRDGTTTAKSAKLRGGMLYYQGSQVTISSVPTSVAFTSDSDDNLFYVKMDFSTGGASWLSTTGTYGANDFPDGTNTYEVMPIAEFDLDTDGTILGCIHHARGTVLRIPGVAG